MKFLKFLDARCFDLRAVERRFEILKFLGAKRFGLRTATTGFLNFTPASRNGFKILKFTPKLRNRFGILKFALASVRLADTAQNFISRNGFKILKFIQEPPFAPRRVLPRVDSAKVGCGCGIAEKRRAVKLTYAGGYLNSARRPIVRLCGAAARRGYEVGHAEKFSKFDLAATLLNFISLPPHKFKLALLKFSPEPPRNGFRILKFTLELLRNRFGILKFTLALARLADAAQNFVSQNGFKILKFTLAPHKFKPASAVRLNFAFNSVPPARAAKFENGVKFKGAAKFERGVR